VYLNVGDIQRAYESLLAKNVAFEQSPKLVAPLPAFDLWMAFSGILRTTYSHSAAKCLGTRQASRIRTSSDPVHLLWRFFRLTAAWTPLLSWFVQRDSRPQRV
jgi:hypothetical protein